MSFETPEETKKVNQKLVDKVIYVTNIHQDVSEDLLTELFMQAGPLEGVHLVRKEGKPTFGFVTFEHAESVVYAIALFTDIKLFGRTLSMKPRQGSTHEVKMRHAQADVRQRYSHGSSPYSPHPQSLMEQQMPSRYGHQQGHQGRRDSYDRPPDVRQQQQQSRRSHPYDNQHYNQHDTPRRNGGGRRSDYGGQGQQHDSSNSRQYRQYDRRDYGRDRRW